jgi:RNA polymerase sigma factor (sigma-70 family)
MASKPSPELLRHVRRLAATEGDPPSDDQLLRLFVGRHSDDAFAAIVRRYGPLVLRVCRQALADGHDAEDAFQATFLVLVRKAASIGRRELLAGWLYGVARRVAARARARAARRRACERPVADVVATETPPGGRELWDVLHEEVVRLPAKYRLPVVLCYLEGRTHDEAARQLGWPKGTVSGRLARAREMLHRRLTRRGLAAPAGGVVVLLWSGSAPAAVPGALACAAVAAARAFASGPPASGAVAASVTSLAEGALQAMFVIKLKTLAAAALLAVVVAVVGAGLVAAGPRTTATGPARQAPPADPAGQTVRAAAPAPADAKDAAKDPVRLHKLEIATLGRLAFSQDGKTLIHAVNRGVRVWDVAGGKEQTAWDQKDWGVLDLAPDGSSVAMVRGLDAPRLFEANTGKERCTLAGRHDLPSNYFIYSPDGKLIVKDYFARLGGRGDDANDVVYTVRIWDTVTGKEQEPLKGLPQGIVRSLAVSRDGKYLALGCNGTDILLYDLAKREKLRQFGEERAPEPGPDSRSPSRVVAITAVAFSPDGDTVAAGDNDGTVYLYETATGKKKQRLGDGPKSLKEWAPCVRQLLFSRDGTTLLALDSYLGARPDDPGDAKLYKLHIWDVAAGKEHALLKLDGAAKFVALSPAGKHLAVVVTGEQKTAWVEVWEVAWLAKDKP